MSIQNRYIFTAIVFIQIYIELKQIILYFIPEEIYVFLFLWLTLNELLLRTLIITTYTII